MKFNSTLFSILFFCLVAFTSCSDDDSELDGNEAVGCADFENEYDAVISALRTYSENPTATNCNSYKSALMDFYQEFSDCSYWGEEYQEAVDDVENMDCSNT